jgi:hypothetical protein
MNDYPISLEQITFWLRSKEQELKDRRITLAEVRESHTDKPAAGADFDSQFAIGRIDLWVSGEIDFQVLRVSDGKTVFIRHEKVSDLNAPFLERAFNDFLQSMTHPDNALQTSEMLL